jgi:hypothetical protein
VLGATGSLTTTISGSTPASGSGIVDAVYRVTTVHGEFVDITIHLEWGT